MLWTICFWELYKLYLEWSLIMKIQSKFKHHEVLWEYFPTKQYLELFYYLLMWCGTHTHTHTRTHARTHTHPLLFQCKLEEWRQKAPLKIQFSDISSFKLRLGFPLHNQALYRYKIWLRHPTQSQSKSLSLLTYKYRHYSQDHLRKLRKQLILVGTLGRVFIVLSQI